MERNLKKIIRDYNEMSMAEFCLEIKMINLKVNEWMENLFVKSQFFSSMNLK